MSLKYLQKKETPDSPPPKLINKNSKNKPNTI